MEQSRQERSELHDRLVRVSGIAGGRIKFDALSRRVSR